MAAARKKRLEWHPEAVAELAESIAWYVERNPVAARRMRCEIEAAALSLIACPIAVSGRSGVVAGTRELPVAHRTPFTLIFVRDAETGDCTVYHCMHQRRKYPPETAG